MFYKVASFDLLGSLGLSSPTTCLLGAGSRDAVRSMIAAAGQSAELAHLTKDAVLLAASQYRNLPPHHVDATSADQAYRRADLPCGP